MTRFVRVLNVWQLTFKLSPNPISLTEIVETAAKDRTFIDAPEEKRRTSRYQRQVIAREIFDSLPGR
jgi:hypothetical protein